MFFLPDKYKIISTSPASLLRNDVSNLRFMPIYIVTVKTYTVLNKQSSYLVPAGEDV